MQEQGYVLVLYDHSAAGYCSSVADRLPEMLHAARNLLDCRADCTSACQHCLLDYDTRFRMDDLDRVAASEFLSESWMQRLRLQGADELFGPGTSYAETQTLAEALTREWAKAGAEELRIYLQGKPEDWDFSAVAIKRLLLRWSERGTVKLALPQSAEGTLSREHRYALGQLTQMASISVHSVPVDLTSALAEVVGKSGCVLWASRDLTIGVPGNTWAQAGSAVLVRGNSATPVPLGVTHEFKSDLPAEVSPAAGRIEIRAELNGLADGFGEKLLERLITAVRGPLLEGEADIKAVIYRDRYLNAPLPVSLLIGFIGAIKARYQSRWDNPVVEVVSVALSDDGRAFPVPTQVFHNWQSTLARDSAIRAAFGDRGMEAVVRNLPKPMASHARTLEIGLADGKKLKVWLDQGFGFWSTPRPGSRAAQASSTWFGFSEAPSWQGQEIGEGRYAIEGQSFPTHVFFEKV